MLLATVIALLFYCLHLRNEPVKFFLTGSDFGGENTKIINYSNIKKASVLA
jgi:hypothetical protein